MIRSLLSKLGDPQRLIIISYLTTRRAALGTRVKQLIFSRGKPTLFSIQLQFFLTSISCAALIFDVQLLRKSLLACNSCVTCFFWHGNL